jgi:hypothetical protein
MGTKTKCRIVKVNSSSAYVENPGFTGIEPHGVANSALPLKETVLNPACVLGQIWTFNRKEFQAVAFDSTITVVCDPSTNPPCIERSAGRSIEIFPNVDQIVANVNVNPRGMKQRPDII